MSSMKSQLEKQSRTYHYELFNMITNEFKLTEINKAIDLLRSGKAGRIVIKMN